MEFSKYSLETEGSAPNLKELINPQLTIDVGLIRF
jgi:hypothetical protein